MSRTLELRECDCGREFLAVEETDVESCVPCRLGGDST